MWRFDFHLFYMGAQAVLAGLSPYTVSDVNYGPYPLALIFVPLALLPESLAYGLFVALNLFLLWKVMGKRMLWGLLFFPMLFSLFVGQVDFLLAALMGLGSPWTLALALCKPQVAVVTLPWLVRRLDRTGWLKAACAGAAFLGLCFVLRPTWVSEWLQAQPGIQYYSRHASNLLWLIPERWMDARVVAAYTLGPLALVLGFWLKNRRKSWVVAQFFQPLSNIYSPAVLTEWVGPLEVMLSWTAFFVVSGDIHNGMPLFVVGLSILARTFWQERQTQAVKTG
jgi:hypothetical protein